MPAPTHPVGSLVVSHNPTTSKTEQALRRRLTEAGLVLHRGRSAIQCGYDDTSGSWPVLTPDFLVTGSRVCIEFDPGFTHSGKEDEDRRRNELLGAIGWTVVRLRTAGLEALGPYDVTTDTASFTVAAVAALVDSVRDAVAGRAGDARHVEKPAPTRRSKSRLGSIATHKHLENAFYASWLRDDGETSRLVVMAGGHFLAGTGAGWGTPAFILRVGLDRLPREKWRGNLEELLSGLPDAGLQPTSWFPWGDELFTGSHAATVHIDRRFNVGAAAHITTLHLPTVETWTATTITCADEGILSLHPEAVAAGWRFADLRQLGGRSGVGHQTLLLMRDGDRRGLWAHEAQA